MESNSKIPKDSNPDIKNTEVIPILPPEQKPLEHEEESTWDFFWNNERMLSSKEMDIIADKMKINRLPEMLFGNNIFYLVNSGNNFLYEINPLAMLDMTSYKWREEKLLKENSEISCNQNFVYYIPGEVKVQYYDKWKDMKIEREDVKKLDPTEDWTFSSPYMGTIHELDKHPAFSYISEKLKTEFDPFKKYSPVEIKKTDMNLPVERLGQENTIIKYTEISLFDDELCDNGVAMGNFRYFKILQ